jgi:hypothetical protein
MKQVKQIVMSNQSHSSGARHEDAGIASTAVMRFRTARPYVLLAHLYVLTRCDVCDEEGKDAQGVKSDFAEDEIEEWLSFQSKLNSDRGHAT